MRNNNRISKRQWIAFGLVTLQWLLMTATEPFKYRGLRWYHTLIISLVAFALMRRKLIWRALGKYRWIFAMYGVSWLLLLLTQENVTFTAERIFKSIVGISTFMLLIPILSHQTARKVLFFGLLYTAIMRCIVIIDYTQSEIFFEGLHGLGKDKNFSGLLLAMGISLLLPFILSQSMKTRYRIISTGLSFWFLYNIFSSGSRSASIAAIASLAVVGFLHLVLMKSIVVKFRTIVFGVLAFLVSVIVLQSLTGKYEILAENYTRLNEFVGGKRADISGRLQLFELAVAKIKENPIIGGGYGSSQYLKGYRVLTHNTYVAQWIEFGFAGVLSLFLFVIYVMQEIKHQLKKMQYDQGQKFDFALVLSGLPFIFMLATLNMGTITIFMICLFAAFEYERLFFRNRLRINFAEEVIL